MVEKVLVSILVTTYNCESFISSTLDSLLAQSYSIIEIIVVDDGSTDRTIEIIKTYAAKNDNIKIFFPGRIGRAKALNLGLSVCQGKYIAINDADDFSLPLRIELQVRWMEDNLEIGLLGTAKIVRENNIDHIESVLQTDSEIRKFLIWGQPIQHSSVMMRNEIINKVNGYNENIPFLLDRDIFIRIARISKLHQLAEPLIILNRSDKQFFKNKFIGLERINLQTKLQYSAIRELGFNRLYYILVTLKYSYSLLLHYKNKF